MKARLTPGMDRLPSRVRLAAAIDALPEQPRLVLSLRLLEGLSVLETAEALQLSAAEVEHVTASALLRLTQEFGVQQPMRRAA